MSTYLTAARNLLQLQREYEQQLAAFTRCRISVEDLNSEESRDLVRQTYADLLRPARPGIPAQYAHNPSAEILVNVFVQLKEEWLQFSSTRFEESCLSLYQACLHFLGARSTDQYAKMTFEAFDVFKEKNDRYGNTFLALGVPGLFTRLGDKFARLVALSNAPELESGTDESIHDTALDAANYSVMLAIAHRLSVGAALPE